MRHTSVDTFPHRPATPERFVGCVLTAALAATLGRSLDGSAAAVRRRCDAGRFVVHHGERLRADAGGTLDVLNLVCDGRRCTIEIVGCPPARAHVRAVTGGTRVTAAWPRRACGRAALRMKALVGDACETLRGAVRAAGARPIRFVAPRCAADGVVDAAAGEECAGPGTCGAGACIDCRCVPLVGFAEDVLPALRGCLGTACHEGPFAPGGFELLPGGAFDALRGRVARSGPCTGSRLVVPGAPDASVLFARLAGTACGTRMPAGSPPLSPAQLDAIRWWIAEGAAATAAGSADPPD